MKLARNTLLTSALTITLLTQITACGTLMHPDRKGQTGGKIDIEVAAFNAIGLAFFVIPGLIAFGLDIYNGTIYLPGGKQAQLSAQQLRALQGTGSLDLISLKHSLIEQGLMPKYSLHMQLKMRPVDNLTQLTRFLETPFKQHSPLQLALATGSGI